MSELFELIELTSFDLDMYKNPNVEACQEKLNELLVAARMPSISDDRLESIDIGKTQIHINVSWCARGCEQSETYTLPMEIILAADPVKAATVWGLKEKLEDRQLKLRGLKKDIERYEAEISKLETLLSNAEKE